MEQNIKSNLEFSILPKDIFKTRRVGDRTTDLLVIDNLLYVLSNNKNCYNIVQLKETL